jgi:hypothetical protein
MAYIAAYELDLLSTVEIVDFSNPAKPVLRGYYDTEGYALDLAVAGNRLYVADDEAGLAIVDLGNPARPARIGGYSTKRSFQRVAVSGRYAHVVDGDTLLILEVSDPSAPFRVGLCDLGAPVRAMQVNWQTAYVLVGTGELRILDVSDPGNVRVVGTHLTWGAQSMAVAGKYAYLAKGNRGLEVVDISDPAKPVWATGLTMTGSAEDVALVGQNVLVAGGNEGLLLYRLEQQIYPPLAPPVIADGRLTLSWPAMGGVRLQRTPELVPATWEDVPESEGTNVVRLAMTGTTGFFRLAKGPKASQWPPGLIAWWPGNGDAKDVVGGHDAMLRGDATFAEGVAGQAFSLDGDGDFVEVPDTPDLNFGMNQFTASIWVLLSSLKDTQIIIEKYVETYADGRTGWGLDLGGNGVLCFHYHGLQGMQWSEHGPITEPMPLALGSWVNLTIRRSGQEATVFRDGVLVASGPVPSDFDVNSTSSLKFGHRGNPQDTPGSRDERQFYLNGRVDEAMLFNRALTDEEIRSIYTAGIAGMNRMPR